MRLRAITEELKQSRLRARALDGNPLGDARGESQSHLAAAVYLLRHLSRHVAVVTGQLKSAVTRKLDASAYIRGLCSPRFATWSYLRIYRARAREPVF